jgi:hypothetical protein
MRIILTAPAAKHWVLGNRDEERENGGILTYVVVSQEPVLS